MRERESLSETYQHLCRHGHRTRLGVTISTSSSTSMRSLRVANMRDRGGRHDGENEWVAHKWQEPQKKTEGRGWADMKDTTADNTDTGNHESKRDHLASVVRLRSRRAAMRIGSVGVGSSSPFRKPCIKRRIKRRIIRPKAIIRGIIRCKAWQRHACIVRRDVWGLITRS